MRILTIHSDFIKFRPTKKAFKGAEEVSPDEKEIKDCLVVFTAVESSDEQNVEGVVKNLVKEVKKSASLLKVRKIVLYPYAHLSSNLSPPDIALKVLKRAKELLSKEFDVVRAPFGWYKKFEISCKGHPLAEASRQISAEVPKKTRKEGSEFHRFFVVSPDGKAEEVTKSNWKDSPLWKSSDSRVKMLWNFVRNELEGNVSKGTPKHIEIMRKLELFDYVPYSDVGNLRAYPNGSLAFDLLSDFVLYNSALKLGCMKLQNPIMYDPSDKTINELVKDFHERDYKVVSDKKTFNLRHSSDVLNFPMLKDINITYKQMPFAIYELAPSFRLEQRGECTGLKRLRSFTMPDIHVFTRTEKESLEKIRELCFNFDAMLKKLIGSRWVLGWEIVESYWEEHKEYFIDIIRKMKCPAFVKLMPEMSHYYAFKNEYQAVSADGSNVQVSTLQLDVKDGERFDIKYLDKDGRKKPCFIIHTAPIGSLERCMYLVLENAVFEEHPQLPVWLSPEQLRIIPVSDKYVDDAVKLSEEIEQHNIRVGVDDRDEKLGKKIYDARTRWIPFIIVLGGKEIKEGKYALDIRATGRKETMTLKEVVDYITSSTKGLPFRPLYTSKLLSRRLVFVPWGK